MLKITELSDVAWRKDNNKVVEGGSNRNLFKSKMSKNTKSGIQMRIRATGEPTFLTLGTKEVFNQLRQVFTKVPIL